MGWESFCFMGIYKCVRECVNLKSFKKTDVFAFKKHTMSFAESQVGLGVTS